MRGYSLLETTLALLLAGLFAVAAFRLQASLTHQWGGARRRFAAAHKASCWRGADLASHACRAHDSPHVRLLRCARSDAPGRQTSALFLLE